VAFEEHARAIAVAMMPLLLTLRSFQDRCSIAGCDAIAAVHLAEAIGYRTLERKGLAA